MVSMSKLTHKFRQYSYNLKKNYFTRNNILIVFVIAMVFCFAWSAITSLTRNWELERKLETRRLEKARLEIEVANLELEQQYYLTAEYQELAARAKQGKILEGETMLILPDNSEAAKNKYQDESQPSQNEKSNFSQWLKFLFG